MESREKELRKIAGVTMVALVVSIIVLLILSGIVITLAVGDNGIITRAKKTAEIYKELDEKEGKELNNLYTQLASINNDNSNVNTEDINKIVESLKTEIISSVYPVGSIYISTEISSKEEVEKRLGGTWESYGEGRTLVGVGTSDKSFAEGETGGESTHTLTVEEMPKHSHIQKVYTAWTSAGGVSSNIYVYDSTHTLVKKYAPAGDNGNTLNAGNSMAHNNMQPYITVYMWRRVE